MIHELLVPLDGSAQSLPALDVAVAFARRLGAGVSVVTVTDPLLDAMPDVVWLDEHTARAGVKPHRRLVVPDTDAVGALLALAEEAPGTTLCMTSHGRSGVTAAVFGSVSAAVVRASRAPVLLVGPSAKVPTSFEAIEVCVNGSPPAERAVPAAAAWARQLDATPWILTVQDADEMTVLADTVAGAELHRPLEMMRAVGLEPEWEVLHAKDPVRALAERAPILGASLIVATTHGRTGLQQVVAGSVASGIVRHAPCPVLLVGPSVTPAGAPLQSAGR